MDAEVQPPLIVPVRRAALLFIFITVLLDILAIGIIIPVLPHLVERFAGGTAQAALWVGVFGTAFAVAQFFCSPLQGALSDRFGRRPVILLSNAGLALDFVLMALANTLPLLFLGRVLAGVTSASLSTANAYIADVTPAEKRAASFGMLGAAFGIGFVIGPALGGLLGAIDLRLPFWVAAGLAAANLCYGWLILPESLPPERRSRFEWKRANPAGSLLMLRRYPQVFGLVGVTVLSQLAHYALPTVFVLYASHRYGWGEQSVGYVLTLVGVCNVIVQAGLVRRLVPRIGERAALLLGLLCGAAGFALQGLAATGTIFLCAIPLMALWGLAGPSLQTLMTRQVDAHEQGRLQGAVTSAVSLTGVIGPAVFSQVFAAMLVAGSVGLSGAPFLLSAALLLVAAYLSQRLTRPAPAPVARPL
ncbi:TCR/Tet family MFS transporter [Pseudomarimonas arenosa]|uniref:TCR/Tet family MFS transporter n=1 Tax=Pseudomarimonas arenosa TaxID=2774145 RepID=A0AAW3ZIA5_9GAMM|nr:TCR/Tet family MFS transporter [Pseudomarimonas arenosa]